MHPDNQSYNGTTNLCHPIGEAIILFATMLREFADGNLIGDYHVDHDHNTIFLEIDVPEDYRLSGVVDLNIYKSAFLWRTIRSASARMIRMADGSEEIWGICIYCTSCCLLLWFCLPMKWKLCRISVP